MRRATEADRAALVAYLAPRAPTSMFLLANLAEHGFDRGHKNAMRYWIATEGDAVTGVVGLSEGGSLMPQLPLDLVAQAVPMLDGERVALMLGPAEQVRPLKAALGLEAAPVQLDRDEPQFVLEMADLRVPEGPGGLVPLTEAPRPLLEDWRVAYDLEAFGGDPVAARARVAGDLDGWIAKDSHRVLMVEGRPVSMTGFNARLPDIVQVGGVWTPPELRRRGHAGRAVALHLAEARGQGVTRATLFAASDAAARIYEALGFAPIGRYTLCLFRGGQVVDG